MYYFLVWACASEREKRQAAAITHLLYYGGIRLSGHPRDCRADLIFPGPCSAGDGRFTASPGFICWLLPSSYLDGLAASPTSPGAVSFLCRCRGYHPHPSRGPASAGRVEFPRPFSVRPWPPAAACRPTLFNVILSGG